jgi:hypothetical protein
MARRIDKLQINALNASNNQILVARSGQLAFDDPGNVFAGSQVSDTANVANTVLSLSNFTTANLAEGTNLYYTNARVGAYVATLGLNGLDLTGNTTSDLAEGNNLYYTNARVQSHLDSAGYQTAANILANVSISNFTTSNLAEGSNLYYSNDRVQAHLDISGYQTAANILANVSVSGADLSGNTTTDLVEGDNLYYSNDRVISALIAGDNISIESNGRISSNITSLNSDVLPSETQVYDLGSSDKRWKDLYLSGNTLYLGDAVVASSGNTLVIDSIQLNSLDNLYTPGRNIEISSDGVISTSADPSEIYDITIDNQVTQILTNSMDNIFTTPSTLGFRYLVYSIALTNISSGAVTLNSNIVYNNNTFVYANSFAIPYGYTIDLIEKPEVLLPNTQVRIQASANNSIAAFVVYKSLDDSTYTSDYGRVLTSNNFQTIFTSSSTSIVESIKISNRTDINLRGTLLLVDSNDVIKTYLAANTLLAKNYYSELLLNPVRIPAAYKLRFAYFNGPNNAITTFVSSRTEEKYDITANTYTINEGQSVKFTVDTENIVDNTPRYYRTLGNVNSNDFVEGNTGSFVILNDTADIILTANSDLSTNEPTESFKIQLLRDSIDGEIVYTSDPVVIIRDTSNLVGVQSVTLSTANITETQAVTFNISTTDADGSGNTLLYYTITGNADIFGGQSGSFAVNNDTANLELIAEPTSPGETRSFAVEIRRDSTSGNVIFTSNTVTVNPYVPNQRIVATGGNDVFESAGNVIHVFKSSNTFAISSLSPLTPFNRIEYVIIGGGGGGVLGGGGAGGFNSNTGLNIPSTRNMVVTVGGGGVGGPVLTGGASRGSNTSISNTGSNLGNLVYGGGSGGAFSKSPTNPGFFFTGTIGGSGGGGGGWAPPVAPPAPSPDPTRTWDSTSATGNAAIGGGTGGVTETKRGSAGGGARIFNGIGVSGGGGGGAGGAGSSLPYFPGTSPRYGSQGGIGATVSWIPPAYGTGGPAANVRYFAGGGSSGATDSFPAPGIAGGGGAGGGTAANGIAGTAFTGGGGGGGRGPTLSGSNASAGASGGSGIVLIRYPFGSVTPNSRISKVLSVTGNTTTLNTNSSIIFSIITEKATNGEVLYYDTSANVSNTTFLQGNTGSFTVTGNVGTVTLTTSNQVLNGTFKLQVRRLSTTGTILASSNTITYTGT